MIQQKSVVSLMKFVVSLLVRPVIHTYVLLLVEPEIVHK
jgi:hypothetical protein